MVAQYFELFHMFLAFGRVVLPGPTCLGVLFSFWWAIGILRLSSGIDSASLDLDISKRSSERASVENLLEYFGEILLGGMD